MKPGISETESDAQKHRSDDLADGLIAAATEAGFPLSGVIDIDLAQPEFTEHLKRYDGWLKAGYAGTMSYLGRGRNRRADPRLVFPEAESLLCVAIPYNRNAAGAESPESGPRYARYLQGGDYHGWLSRRLDDLMTEFSNRNPELRLSWKVCVDTSAVLERTWASLAGLGWIGKNTLLIHPQHGSYLFLGEVLINRATGRGPSPLPNYCGNCDRCLKGCPTAAFAQPGLMDANRCISYATLEKRKDFPIQGESKNSAGRWIAGCDVCQEVCPFNLKASRSDTRVPEPLLADWIALLKESEAQYLERVRESALERVKPAQFRRNLAITLKNALTEIPRSSINGFASALLPLAEARMELETDEFALQEWRACFVALSAAASCAQ